MIPIDRRTEWLEADGLGGFASGTTSAINTRRYHGLLTVALNPPADRHVLVNDLVLWLEGPAQPLLVSQHRYRADVTRPPRCRVVRFEGEPWPRTTYRVVASDSRGVAFELEREVIALHGFPLVLVTFHLEVTQPGWVLCVRPLLSGRGFHCLHHENPTFRFDSIVGEHRLEWPGYPGLPAVLCATEGAFHESPVWYRQIEYEAEQERGLDAHEDLASPGVLRFDLSEPAACGEPNVALIFAQKTEQTVQFLNQGPSRAVAETIRARERQRRTRSGSPLDRAAEAYLVQRGAGRTIIAGYPWFGDWGRDTFIALRGLCFARGEWQVGLQILLEWSQAVSEGMLPNRFPDEAAAPPEYNAVDASLWFVIVVGELIRAAAHGAVNHGSAPAHPARDAAATLDATARASLIEAVLSIVFGYRNGTRHGIFVDTDGLLAAGAQGHQLTWMDAKVGDWVVTPRRGKPVEVQALWLNALFVAQDFEPQLATDLHQGLASFARRFETGGEGLYDVVDVDGVRGAVDRSLRPNQIFAVGGLPLALVSPQRCRRVVELVERELLTPLGLRSLGPSETLYVGSYCGGPVERDGAYHQGTVWPWLLGAFVEAWLKVKGNTEQTRAEARRRFLAPLQAHVHHAGVGHISEIVDGSAPHTPRGCPFQAWSLGELLRLERVVLRAG